MKKNHIPKITNIKETRKALNVDKLARMALDDNEYKQYQDHKFTDEKLKDF